MQVNEICTQTGLTKKAIEYYQSKGLVTPITKENGYREFTDNDLEHLKSIALLRKLDLTTDEIKQVMESKDRKAVLMRIKKVKQIQVKTKQAKIDLIEQFISGQNIAELQEKMNLLDQQATIKEKLLIAFPGYHGRYTSLHFGHFLNEPIKTEEQNKMYAVIVDFLDNMEPIEIPKELQALLDDADGYMDDEVIEKLDANMLDAFDDFDAYWEKNKESLTQYAEFKKSDEYHNSVMAQLMNLFRRFGETSGYYDVFIPAMRKLSRAYDDYYTKMLEANEKLMQKIPDIEKM